MKFNNKNISLGKNVKIGENTKIGDNTIIYDNVTIGDNTVICNDCVIGEPTSSYYFKESYVNTPTTIGSDSLIRSHTIIYSGSIFGSHLHTGHRVTIRENTILGKNCMVGSYSDIQGFCKIGDFNRFHSYVNVGQKSETGNFVFLYPFVVLTNDPTPPSDELVGVKIGDYTQISTSSILLPGAEIGKHSLVAANSCVVGLYTDDSFISGSPAKRIGKLSKMPFFNLQNKRHYPWVHNFKRGMPWENTNYNEWKNE